MSSVAFTLLLGMLSGLAGFVSSASLEIVLGLGLLGISHFALIAARNANQTISRSRTNGQ